MPKVTITIDDQQLSVEQGTTVLEAAKLVGVEIPHYCYHPGLSIAGNCRMCLVEVEKAPKPMIGCNTFVAEGMVVKTKTPKVEKMRQSVMEFLLINHPLDCPTCDQAGECRLQDYYMQYDEIPSRFKETKVHKDKMVDLGSNVMLDQERCVACTRCIRFCDEIAGKDELTLANRGDHVTITTFPGKELVNPYAGNVIDICPVGALTNKDFRYKKRVWFLKKTNSICPNCSRGCNIEVHHADAKIFRMIPRPNAEVNEYWMCDEGRYGYKFVNEGRILRHFILENGQPVECTYEDALAKFVGQIQSAGPNEIAIVAHAWETNETLKAIQDFAKNALKTNQLYFSRNNPPNPSSDDYLITADKNPNQAGVDALGFKPVAELKKAKGVIVFHGLSSEDEQKIRSQNIPVLALFAYQEQELAKTAQIIFPTPTFAEQNGTFTNVQGITQRITAAFPPQGESRPAEQTLADAGGLTAGPLKKAVGVSSISNVSL